jgi:hypothetical protein
LGEDADKLGSEESGGVLTLFGAEDAVKALNSFGGTAAVQGRKNEMASFSGLEGGAGGGGIPNFPKKYNVWALA